MCELLLDALRCFVNTSPALHKSIDGTELEAESLEQVGLDCVGFPVERGQNAGEGPGRHTVRRLPGLQQVLGLDGAGPRRALEALVDGGRDGGVGEGGRGARDRAGAEAAGPGAAHVPGAGQRRRAVGRRAAGRLFRLVVFRGTAVLARLLAVGAGVCSFGVGGAFLFTKLGASVLEPNLRKKKHS